VVSGFLEMGGAFARTPKFGVEGPRRAWSDRRYDEPLATVLPEVGLGGWCLLGVGLALANGVYRMAPSVGFFAGAFACVVAMALAER
jgi:hypothetical protein